MQRLCQKICRGRPRGRIASATVFGSKNLLNATQTFTFHVGYDGSAYNQFAITVSNANATTLLGASAASVVASITGSNAAAALASIDVALTSVASIRSDLGAVQNRLESTVNNLNVAVENLSASESRIRDTDIAEETVGSPVTRSSSRPVRQSWPRPTSFPKTCSPFFVTRALPLDQLGKREALWRLPFSYPEQNYHGM